MSFLCYWTKYLPDGGIQWLLVKPWTSFIKQCAWLSTGTLPWPSKWPALSVYFLIVVCLPDALAAAEVIRIE